MAFETILLDIHGKVGLITLNRPQALNALNAQIVGEINQALDQLERDPSIGCVVLTGSAKAFAAGADIKEMADLQYPQIYVDDLFSDADRIANRRKPIIAAVSGFALGGGCELAMMCDFILPRTTPSLVSRKSTLACCRAWAAPSGSPVRWARPRPWNCA